MQIDQSKRGCGLNPQPLFPLRSCLEKGQGVGWGTGGILEPQRGYNASSVGDADAAITAAER